MSIDKRFESWDYEMMEETVASSIARAEESADEVQTSSEVVQISDTSEATEIEGEAYRANARGVYAAIVERATFAGASNEQIVVAAKAVGVNVVGKHVWWADDGPDVRNIDRTAFPTFGTPNSFKLQPRSIG